MSEDHSADERHTEVLALVSTELEAELILEALEEQGIDGQAVGALTAGFRAEAPGHVRVIVGTDDHARAREILDEHRKSASEIDWSKVDVGESDAP